MTTTSFRAKIFPSIKAAYIGGFQNFATYFKISWLCISILVTLHVLNYMRVYLDFFPFLSKTFFSLSFMQVNLIWEVIFSLVEAIFIVGFYRFLVLEDKSGIKIFSLKRGIAKEQKILSVPYYFRWGKAEFFTFILGVFFTILYMLPNKIYTRYILSQDVIELTPDHVMTYQMLHYSWLVLYALIGAALALVWPYLAVKNEISLRGALKTIKAMRGNIIRVAIIAFLIYLPFYMIEQILLYTGAYFDEAIQSNLASYLINVISMLTMYVFLAADMYFIRMVYEKAYPEND